MTLEPKTLEAGFVKRLLKKSFAMLLSSPIEWSILVFLLWFIGLNQFNLMLDVILGLFFVLIGLELSIYTYDRKSGFKYAFNGISKSLTGFLIQFFIRRKYFIFIFIFYLVIESFSYYLKHNLSTESLLKIKASELARQTKPFVESYWILIFGILTSMAFIALGIFTHFLNRFFNLNDEIIIENECKKIALRNVKFIFVHDLFILTSIIIIPALEAVFLFFILYPLYCGFIYAAFKEIYNFDSKLQLEEEVKEKAHQTNIALN